MGSITTNRPARKEEPVASTKPGTEDKAAEKKPKVKRVVHPALLVDGKRVKLKEIPADFDPKAHKPLGRKDFEDESNWWELKAREHERKATECRAKGEESKKLGSIADRAKAKRLLAMTKKIDELKAALAGQGVDVEAMLAGLKTNA